MEFAPGEARGGVSTTATWIPIAKWMALFTRIGLVLRFYFYSYLDSLGDLGKGIYYLRSRVYILLYEYLVWC